MPLKPSYLLLLGGGAIVAVAGVKGYAPSKVLRDVISGQNPSANPTLASQITGAQFSYGYGSTAGDMTQQPLNTLGPAGTTGSSASGIVGLAEAHPLPYAWGGSPNSGKTDCSSWVNYIVGMLAGLSIPGFPNGSFKGTSHGPNTLAWLAWGAAGGMTKITASQATSGDLVIWQTHMGIVTSPGQMISDLNQSLGTRQTSIVGGAPSGEIATYWRLK